MTGSGRQMLGASDMGAPLIVDVGGTPTRLQVHRHARARRSLLRLSSDGDGVVLVLPLRARLEDGLSLVRSHASWIRSQLESQPPRVPFADGAQLPVNGRPLTVRLTAGARREVRADGDHLVVQGPSGAASSLVGSWLRGEARQVILRLIGEKASSLRRAPSGVGVRDTRSRWGSCSSRGRLSFCWRLILAPPLVLDYVVAHELAHLDHRAHDGAFWAKVDELCREAAAGRIWLRHHGRGLFRYG